MWLYLIWATLLCVQVVADDTQWIQYTDDNGNTLYLDNDRQPSLYTGDFGDCQGNSLVHVTRFDASLYKDNMTVMLHVSGTSALQNEHIMSKNHYS